MKKCIFVCLLLLLVTDILAIPARRNVAREVILADGTKVTAFLKGDENGHWWETLDGQCLQVDATGNAKVLTYFEKENWLQAASSRRIMTDGRRKAKLNSRAAANNAIVGKKKGLVILINFKDASMKTSQPKTYFNRQFNEEGFSDDNHIGCVREYFYDQSYGQLDVKFDVVGPVTLSNNLAYYGQNDDSDNDKYPCTMVAEACKLADNQVDFSDYDWDGDGEVDQVYLIYAGYGENYGAAANTIWPHEWTLASGQRYGDGDGALTLDGVTVNTYAVSCELAGTKGKIVNGIGTACHEFSHCLGLPDFYDTSSSGTGWGMDAWDVMCSGSYSGPDGYGEVPCGYTSYERWYAGWLQPTELEVGMNVEAQKPLNDSPEAYILYNDNHKNEYYLLENRQSSRWFSYVDYNTAPSGLLVIHVDYDKNAWANNVPNGDASHQRMTIFQANNMKGTLTSNGYDITATQYYGHLYPYGTNDSLTNKSVPAATVYNVNTDDSKYMNKGIFSIKKASDGTISYTCSKSAPASSQEEAEPGDIIFYESFDNCSGTGGNDGKWGGNIATGSFLSDNSGWNSIRKYGANQCARFGNADFVGKATTPSFNLNGDATLTFVAGSWANDKETLTVSINGTALGTYDIPTKQWTEITIPLTGTGHTTLTFTGGKRFFLDEVKVVKAETDGIKKTIAGGRTDRHIYSITGLDLGTDINNVPEGVYIYNGRKYIKK